MHVAQSNNSLSIDFCLVEVHLTDVSSLFLDVHIMMKLLVLFLGCLLLYGFSYFTLLNLSKICFCWELLFTLSFCWRSVLCGCSHRFVIFTAPQTIRIELHS